MNLIEFGDCRETMRRWAREGVKAQMCVTSPPYYGLRDYGHDGQLGLEQTPEEYIAAMVEVFRCVRDVLVDDGTLWLNIGDSYARQGGKQSEQPRNWDGRKKDPGAMHATRHIDNLGDSYKPKDLIGIPWMLAFALRADGWYLRQDIIWHKPNPMPESVRDRCTKAHEYIFLLSKSERYFFDSEAMKEPASAPPKPCGTKNDATRNDSGRTGIVRGDGETRNRRSVWSVATRPYKGAHFATFPPALIEPCILAGSSERGHCPKCGAKWFRQVERTPMVIAKTERNEQRGTATGCSGTMVSPASSVTTGWAASCKCGLEPIPDVVLDPFIGSGTTAMAAQQHGRQYLGCELNPEYAALQRQRLGLPERVDLFGATI